MYRKAWKSVVALLVLTSAFFAIDAAEQTNAVRDFEIRFTPGPKADPLETPTLSIAYKASDQTQNVALSSKIESIDELHYLENRCIVLGSLGSSSGRSVSIVDAKAAKVLASISCFAPVISPGNKRIAFDKWYPRFTPREKVWPVVFIIPTENAEAGPVQVYPEKSSVEKDNSSENHLVVSPKVWSAEGDALAFLDMHGDYGDWKSPYKLYCVLVRIKDGKPLRAKRALVQVDSFVTAGANPEEIAFTAESLEISDGRLRGKLYPQGYWVRSDFAFTLDAIDQEQTLSIKDIQDTVANDRTR